MIGCCQPWSNADQSPFEPEPFAWRPVCLSTIGEIMQRQSSPTALGMNLTFMLVKHENSSFYLQYDEHWWTMSKLCQIFVHDIIHDPGTRRFKNLSRWMGKNGSKAENFGLHPVISNICNELQWYRRQTTICFWYLLVLSSISFPKIVACQHDAAGSAESFKATAAVFWGWSSILANPPFFTCFAPFTWLSSDLNHWKTQWNKGLVLEIVHSINSLS